VVQIGTGYVLFGNDVIITCNIGCGNRPITIMWFRNGVEVLSFRNVSTITIPNVGIDDDRDMYWCRAENEIGFDEETTVINVFGECSLHVSLRTLTLFLNYTFNYRFNSSPIQPVI